MSIPRYHKLTIFLVFFAILLSPSLISDSSALLESGKLHWQIVYIDNKYTCLPLELQKIQEYDQLVKNYFGLYQFDTFNYEPNCMSLTQYSSYREPYYLDLLILFFDENLAHRTLGYEGLRGLYTHTGIDRSTNHFILFNDRPNYHSNYDSKNPSWVLSNSLSHFILYYKGYNADTIEQLIQPDEPFYKNCFGKTTISGNCKEVKLFTTVQNLSKDFLVIPPFENAVGNNIIQYIESDISESEIVNNLYRQITKWWISGKISDDDYIDTLQYFARIPSSPSTEIPYYPLLEIRDGFVIPVFSFEKEGKNQDITSNRERIQQHLKTIDDLVPFDRARVEKLQDARFPDWFKERATLWVTGEINDYIFLDSLESLLRSKSIIP